MIAQVAQGIPRGCKFRYKAFGAMALNTWNMPSCLDASPSSTNSSFALYTPSPTSVDATIRCIPQKNSLSI